MRLAGYSDISNTCTVLNLVGTNAIIFFGKTHEGLDYLAWILTISTLTNSACQLQAQMLGPKKTNQVV